MLSFILVWLRKETFLPHPLAAYYNPPFHTAPQSTLLVAGWLLLFSPLLFLHYILWSNPAPLGRDDVQEVAKAMMLSHIQLFVTPWTITQQVPLSMEFSRQKYWSRLPFPSPGDLPNPGTASLVTPAWQADSLPLHHLGSPDKKWNSFKIQVIEKYRRSKISFKIPTQKCIFFCLIF